MQCRWGHDCIERSFAEIKHLADLPCLHALQPIWHHGRLTIWLLAWLTGCLAPWLPCSLPCSLPCLSFCCLPACLVCLHNCSLAACLVWLPHGFLPACQAACLVCLPQGILPACLSGCLAYPAVCLPCLFINLLTGWFSCLVAWRLPACLLGCLSGLSSSLCVCLSTGCMVACLIYLSDGSLPGCLPCLAACLSIYCWLAGCLLICLPEWDCERTLIYSLCRYEATIRQQRNHKLLGHRLFFQLFHST